MAQAKGPLGKRLRKHLRGILEEQSSGGIGRPTDDALVAELRFRHPQDYSAVGMKERVLLREVSAARTELERATADARSSASTSSSGSFQHVHPQSRTGIAAWSIDRAPSSGGEMSAVSDGEDADGISSGINNNSGPAASSRKRRLPGMSTAEAIIGDEEAEAREHDAARRLQQQPFTAGGGSGASLNRSVSATYTKQSSLRERATVLASTSSDGGGPGVAAEASQYGASGGNGPSGAAPTSAAAAAPAATPRRKRRLPGSEGSSSGAENSSGSNGGAGGALKLTSALEWLTPRPSAR